MEKQLGLFKKDISQFEDFDGLTVAGRKRAKKAAEEELINGPEKEKILKLKTLCELERDEDGFKGIIKLSNEQGEEIVFTVEFFNNEILESPKFFFSFDGKMIPGDVKNFLKDIVREAIKENEFEKKMKFDPKSPSAPSQRIEFEAEEEVGEKSHHGSALEHYFKIKSQ